MSVFEVDKGKRHILEPLVSSVEDTMILTCIQGCGGEAYADDLLCPSSARLDVADFSFLCGKPNRELAALPPADPDRKFLIMIPETEKWAVLVESIYGENCQRVARYRFHRTPGVFSPEKLRQAVNALDSSFELRKIDEEIYHRAMTDRFEGRRWAADWCAWFDGYEDYRERGLGVAILHGGELVSGASSYTCYDGGIEIQIDTRRDYRHRGLACVCASALILECVRRGIYPGWDAQNLYSANLAKKLGYQFAGEYVAYEVNIH